MTDLEHARIEFTTSQIPEGVTSILDVGAGDGRITRVLLDRGYAVTASDISEVALAKIPAPTLLAYSDSLPAPDRSFDLVITTEMLEHIPARDYARTLSELARVARKYVLVTVPNSETINAQLARCPCGAMFHIWDHKRRYTERGMVDMIPGFHLEKVVPFGPPSDRYLLPLLWLRHFAGAYEWLQAGCPQCGNVERPKPRLPLIAKACDFLHYRILRPFETRPTWLLALYSRQ